MSSLCSCSFIGTKYLWIALLTNQEKNTFSRDNFSGEQTKAWNKYMALCFAWRTKKIKAEAERTSNQTNNVTSATSL